MIATVLSLLVCLSLCGEVDCEQLRFYYSATSNPDTVAKRFEQDIVPLIDSLGVVLGDAQRPADEWIVHLIEAPDSVAADVVRRIHTHPSTRRFRRFLFSYEMDPNGANRAGIHRYKRPLGPGTPEEIIVTHEGPLGEGRGHWRHYDHSQGFPGGMVTFIAHDPEGNLWVGTRESGLSRFDGTTWKAYTKRSGLPDEDIRSGLVDQSGNVWVGSQAGVTRFDGTSWSSFSSRDGLPSRFVWSLFESRNGHIWAGLNGGVGVFGGRRWVSIWPENGNPAKPSGLPWGTVNGVIEDHKGGIWFGTSSGLAVLNGSSWHQLGDEPVWRIAADVNGGIWIATSGALYHNPSATYVPIDQMEKVVDNQFSAVYPDPDGKIWLGKGSDLFVLEDDIQRQVSITDSPYASISVLMMGREGQLWIGGRAGPMSSGAVSVYSRTFTTFGAQDGLPSRNILSIHIDGRDRLWMGTDKGLSVIEDAKIKYIGNQAFKIDRPLAIAEDADRLWFGTPRGMFLLDGQVLTRFTVSDGLNSNSVPTLHVDQTNTVWIANPPGDLSALRDGELTTSGRPEGYRSYLQCISEGSDGELWFGYWRRGVVSVSSSRDKFQSVEEGLINGSVWAIEEDTGGNVWFGTSGGVTRYDGERLVSYTSEDGLGDNAVNAIFEDSQGRVWFGTAGGGASVFDGIVFQTLTQADGLGSNHVAAINEDREGNIWFATSEGLTRYTPPQPFPPSVVIREIAIDGRRSTHDEISISSDTDLVTIKFRGKSMKTRPGAMKYAYRLVGFSDEWLATGDEAVEYADLPTGDYSFEVKAVDRDLVYSVTPARVAIAVHLPYGRLGMTLGLVVASCLVIWQTVRVVRRGRRLAESNSALSDANRELFEVNIELQRDRAVERIRANVQSMDRAEDFERVLSALSGDLREVGFEYDSCGIDVLIDPVAEMTDEHFEQHGFNYVSYTIDPGGEVTSEEIRVSAPFPHVVRGTVDRFVAGDPWQGTSSGTAIVEVPASRYGRLRLTSTQGKSFSDDEVGTLQRFARAIALGYARYLDIREIQEQTERKSAFLAAIAHELRTPMNAIKGFANLVKRREPALTERGQENLEKVDRASDHLLEMINDLLDLSKIEAGRMDVNAETFDVKSVIQACCDTVSPLVKEGVELRQDVREDVGEAHTDQQRVRQMVINLLSNALKFTDSGTVTVRVRVSERESPSTTLGTGSGAGEQAKNLLISVSDTGKGIPEDEIPHLFDEYRQVKGTKMGTGLGLSITKRFAEMLGGSVEVESEAGKGSEFTLSIPHRLTGDQGAE